MSVLNSMILELTGYNNFVWDSSPFVIRIAALDSREDGLRVPALVIRILDNGSPI